MARRTPGSAKGRRPQAGTKTILAPAAAAGALLAEQANRTGLRLRQINIWTGEDEPDDLDLGHQAGEEARRAVRRGLDPWSAEVHQALQAPVGVSIHFRAGGAAQLLSHAAAPASIQDLRSLALEMKAGLQRALGAGEAWSCTALFSLRAPARAQFEVLTLDGPVRFRLDAGALGSFRALKGWLAGITRLQITWIWTDAGSAHERAEIRRLERTLPPWPAPKRDRT